LKQFWQELTVLRQHPEKVKQMIQFRENKKQLSKGRPPVTVNCLL
jgi:hypothetical protein